MIIDGQRVLQTKVSPMGGMCHRRLPHDESHINLTAMRPTVEQMLVISQFDCHMNRQFSRRVECSAGYYLVVRSLSSHELLYDRIVASQTK